MKRLNIILALGLGLFIVILLIINYRYPLYTPKVGPWSVGFQYSDTILESDSISPLNIITYRYVDSIAKRKVHYVADPFFVHSKNLFYLFVEEKGDDNANIALFISKDGKNYDYKGVVLDEDFHLSYPQVFQYKNDFYMLPETKGANNVILYKAVKFPFSWVISDTLVHNKSLKDPSILISKNRNLIVTADDDLHQVIFEADSLHGEWKVLKSYEKWGNETRPGGRFFEVDGDWYLPVQNRSLGYGTGISIYKLQNTEEVKFIKNKHLFLSPKKTIPWFNRGMHHLDIQKVGNKTYMVYDGDHNPTWEKEFQYKRSLKLMLTDIYNWFK